jgi:ferric-dicitrate binding protein FerR (iron transport regulator)
MKKSILFKYIKGELTESEKLSVLEWASLDRANELYLAKLKNLHVSLNMPQEDASEREIEDMMKRVRRTSSEAGYYRISKRVIWSAASVITILAISAVLMMTNWNRPSGEGGLVSQTIVNELKYKNITPAKTLYTPKGVKARLILPDSSQVWLNSDTWISYPDTFATTVRNVTISGEAYFSVVKNPDRPMLVSTTKGFSVRVTGTEFNIKAYQSDNSAQTTLYSGEIYLLRKNDNQFISTKVEPNQTVIINTAGSRINLTAVMKQSPLDDAAWKEGKMIFESTPMSEVITTLERWHGVDFVIKNKEVLNYRITATFNSESIVQIMDLICMTTPIRFEITNRKVVLDK